MLVRTLLMLLALISLPAIAQADFYVVGAGGRIAGTEIKSLPYTISSSGFYYITKDLNCAEGFHGITIESDDVTLDLMGFNLIGPGGSREFSGIYMSGQRNVEIRNGTVQDFPAYGICEDSNENGVSHKIINVSVHDNGATGIYLLGKSHLVQGCTSFSHPQIGIQVIFSSEVTNCTTYSNGYYGISLSNGSSAIGNTCYENIINGINGIGSGVLIISNTCTDNGTGIYATEYCLVQGNTCFSNSANGIDLNYYNLVINNVAGESGTTDIDYGCDTCQFANNFPPAP